MYVPRAFAETDLAALDRLIERDSFVTLVGIVDGVPHATHLPVLYRRDDQHVELRGHLARPNPQARVAGPVLAIVHGPHAYVSPGWYPDKEAQSRVPTWNYAVAHLEGELELFDDEPSVASIVDALSVHHEFAVGGDWRFEHERDDHRSQLRGIVGFRLVPRRIQLTFKLNQNHPAANRLSVAANLDSLAQGTGPEVARLMRERTPV
ncbi:FMN-binding negative transcriptional regulator [Lysobacter korlensis]|uniref:FMN-binding negative transcriptional regulator n=1 Tax=Lysobacter korlensis TaxID=553636 RepID=A0ABV6RQN1_9GAMM